ncbi:hypothetical protein ACH5RR_006297 [Cinchona calisaya]|uniref:Uncharacterized protein n=1 Tax=Cinchona calisaya TaxID=153742 RepID=A0ABD3ANX9_9GENT
MVNKETSIACISGESVSLKVTQSGTDLKRLLAEAKKERSSPGPRINVLRVDRDGLVSLAKHLGYRPQYSATVNGKPTSLKVKQVDLLSFSLIISKVVDKQIMMHGFPDGHEPRNGNGFDWMKIREDDDRGRYRKWNLGSGTILSMSKAGSSSSRLQPKTADKGTSSSSQPKAVDKGTSSNSKPKMADKRPPKTSKKH